MIRALSMLAEDIREKSRWCYKSDSPRNLIKTLATDGTFSMVVYRLMQGSRESNLGALEMVFNKVNGVFGNCIIGRGADFGPGFVLFHSNGVVINGKVKGGEKIYLHHEVTIGNNERGETPRLGNNIHFGAGAKVIGAVKLSDGVRVGANAVVVHDVAPDTTVVGIPARPVKRRESPPTHE